MKSLWAVIKQIPSFIQESLDRWVERTRVEQEERAFLRAYARAKTDEERKKLTTDRLQVHLDAFGCDISGFTDEEIEEGTKRFAEVIASTGVTLEEAGRNVAAALVREEL